MLEVPGSKAKLICTIYTILLVVFVSLVRGTEIGLHSVSTKEQKPMQTM